MSIDPVKFSAVAGSPQKQIIKDLLIIDDISGYASGDSFAEGYETTSFTPTGPVLGVSEDTQNRLTTAKADVNKIHTALYNKLTGVEKGIYEQFRDRLTQPESKDDLRFVLQELERQSLSPKKQQIIKDLLIIDDISGYASGDSFAEGYETTSFTPTGPVLGVSEDTQNRLTTAKADVNNIHDDLYNGLNQDGKQVYAELRGMLTLPESKDDLRAAICILDNNEDSFCEKDLPPPAPTPNTTIYINNLYPGSLQADGKPASVRITTSELASGTDGLEVTGARLWLTTNAVGGAEIMQLPIDKEKIRLLPDGSVTLGTNDACDQASSVCVTIPKNTSPGGYILHLQVNYTINGNDYTSQASQIVQILAPLESARTGSGDDDLAPWMRRLLKGGSALKMHLGYGGSSAPKSDRYAMANYEKPLGDIQLKISPLIVDKPNHQLIAALNADYAIAPNREGGRDQWSRKGRVGLSGEYTPIFPEWWQARLPLKMSIDLYDYSEQFSNPNRPLSGEVVFDMRLTPTLTPFQDAALSFTVLLDYQRRWLSYDDKVARDEFAKSRQTGEVGARVDIGKVRRKKGIVPRVSAGATFLMGKSEVPNRDVKSTKGETRDLDGNHFMLELNFEKFSLAGTYNRLADGTRTSHHGMLSAAPDLDKAGQFKFTLGSTEAFAMDSFLISDEQHLFLSDFNFTPRYDDSWVPLFLIFSWKSQAGPLWAQCFSLNALAEWERTGDKNDGGGGGYIGYDFWQLMHGGKK